jgi:threonine dehydrogenase-like Zn-dependent dehydrogenase
MRALTVSPGIADSAGIDDVPEPPLSDGSVLARALALGVCVTDREILSGVYGSPPPGEQRLVRVRGLDGTFHSDAGTLDRLAPDILMECTGAPSVIKACLGSTARAGITCLAGVTEPGKMLDIDIGRLNRTMVLHNDCVFGSVNANRRHYESAAQALADADKNWLRRLITRRVPLERWSEAIRHRPGDIKVIIEFAQGGHAVPH